MANWQVYETKSRTPRLQILSGKFTVGASGAVSSQDCDGFTVTKESAAGQYRLTLDEAFNDFRGLDVDILDATDVLFDTILSEDVDGNRRITFQFWDADTPAATNPTAATVILLRVYVKNTNL